MFRKMWIVIGFSCLVACGGGPESWPKQSFDRSAWLKTTENERYIFARDIVSSQLLIGKSRSQIKEILGAPSYEDSTGSYMTYVIATHSESFDQIYVLDIRFGVDRLANKVIIRGD